MSYVITPEFHKTITESILKDIRSNISKYYYYLGKTIAFNQANTIEEPINTPKYEIKTRNEMILFKRINTNDAAFIAVRNDWTSGVIYDYYDDSYSLNNPAFSGATSIENAKFFVVTANYNVYKCLDNNNNSASTIEPTGTDYDSFYTADGYKWKFMLSIPLILRNKFLTNSFFPITTALSTRYYNNGGIDNIIIQNGGQGYSNDTIIHVISDSGTGAILNPIIENGVIVDVEIVNPGEGYINVNFLIDDLFGSGENAAITCSLDKGDIESSQANVELNVINGSIEYIKVVNKGNNYSSPTVLITGDGNGCTANVILDSNKQIQSIQITNKGIGYTTAEVTILDSTGTDGSVRAIISPLGGHGKNAVNELYATRLMFYCNIREDMINGFSINNDYRQFGIIRSPLDLTGKSFDNIIGTTCYSTTASGSYNSANFPTDSILTVSNIENIGKRFVVVSSDDNGLLLQSLDNLVLTKDIVLRNDQGVSYAASTITNPSIDKSSGDILYIDNRSAFYQTTDQSINLQTIIRF